MLSKREIKKIKDVVNSIDRGEIAYEMAITGLEWCREVTNEATVYAELDLDTLEIDVKARADFEWKPKTEEGLWIAQLSTYNMDEIPDDYEGDFEDENERIATFYKECANLGYGAIEFLEEYEVEDMIKKQIYGEVIETENY